MASKYALAHAPTCVATHTLVLASTHMLVPASTHARTHLTCGVMQGAFRGLGDTRTPLYATLVSTVLSLGLDVLLIFTLGLGVAGAAWATVLAEVSRQLVNHAVISQHLAAAAKSKA